MRYLMFFLGLAIIASCSKESENSFEGNKISSISGKIDNWSLGEGKKLILCQYLPEMDSYNKLDSSVINSSGEFNIVVSAVPKLVNINLGDSVTYSNENTHISDGHMHLLVYSNNKIVGSLIYGKFINLKEDRYPGDIGLGYYYVDNNVDINCNRYKRKIDLNLSKGYNRCILKYVDGYPNDYLTELINYSSQELNGSKWIFSNVY